MPKDLKNNLFISIPFVITAGIFAALQGAFAKFEAQRISAEAVFFFRFSIGLFLITVWTVSTSKPAIVKNLAKTHKVKLHIVRALAGSTGSLLYYFSLKYTSLSSATVLFQTIPIFVPFIARIWLKIRINHCMWWGLSVAFLGIVFIVKPSGDIFNWGSLLALGSGILGAVSSVIARQLHSCESSQKILWLYFFIASIYGILLFGVSYFISPVTFEEKDYLVLGLIGLAGVMFQYLFVVAVRFSPARLVTPFIYFSMIFTVLLDIFYYDAMPDIYEILGIIMIIAGVILILVLFPKENAITYIDKKEK